MCKKKSPNLFLHIQNDLYTTMYFFLMAAATILFLMDSCPQAFWEANLENGSFWLGAKKNIWEELPCDIGHRPICEK